MITEREDVFEMTAPGLVVASCKVDASSWQLELHSPTVRWTLRIEGSFHVTHSRGDSLTAPAKITDLIGESLQVLRARKADGELEVMFTHGCVLAVKSDPRYEAWEMFSDRGDKLVAVPGDGIARWRANVDGVVSEDDFRST